MTPCGESSVERLQDLQEERESTNIMMSLDKTALFSS